jgi:hypothetical protein
MKKLCMLCTLLLGTGLVLAQTNDAVATKGESARGPVVPMTVYDTGTQGFVGEDDVLGVPAFAGDANARGGETTCPAGYLAGQDPGACGSTQWYFYTDLMFCNPAPTTCRRVRCENFPDPTHTITKAIGVISWTAVYVDDASNGCSKPSHLFRVRFYQDSAGAPANPTVGFYTEEHEALAADTGRTVTFATVPATVWLFTFVLDNPVNLTTGWFSICGDGTPGCYHLWEGSAQGDNKFYQWYETDATIPGAPQTTFCDLAYCFSEKKIGACCDECVGGTAGCIEDASDVYCAGIGGRWAQGLACADLVPPCGEQTGACCHDDGTCEQALCCDCEPTHAGCTNVCVGDLNCDGMIDFGDINPFVQYMSNFVGWQAAYPACNAANGDINCDGTFGQSSFGDINPFVALMTQCGSGCACPGPGCQGAPRDQGTYWAGPGTTCQPYPAGGCCTVVVPPGAPHLEGEADNCAPDVTNGGCNITPALFTPIENGWTVYGKSGTFSAGDPPVNYRDLDWYQTTTTTPVSFTVTVEAEFDVAVWAARAGPDPGDPCTGWRDVSAVVAPTAASHNLCTPVQLVTRCLPAGTYWLVVMPAEFSGVRCNSDYKITLEESGMCEVLNSCANCPSGSYVEGTNIGNPGYCDDEPADPDPNGGCDTEPLDPNAFEPLPIPDPPAPFTFCGKLWATGGFRDLDWYVLNLAEFSQVQWTAITEVPCRATILFQYLPGGAYGPPAADCSNYYYWADTLCAPCVPKTWSGTTYYQPGAYWFLVAPEEASGPVFYGYPCPLGAADLGNDYQVTLTVTAFTCASEILAAPYAYVEAPADPPCPASGYVDTYNSGCDQAPTGPVLPLPFSTPNGWLGRSGTWLTDPNEPTGLSKDYDWYQFTLTANRRFKVLLYADFPATWEIWKPDDCAYGPIEGLDVPPCFNSGVYTVRCYLPGTYWLRVYPTNVAACGQYYYLALTEAGACSLCNFSCTGTDLDDPCNDELDYDTNAGCDDPNGPPPHFMTFNCGATYCGRIYAGLVSGAPYYDPDWFQITQTNATDRRLRLTVTAEFLAHVEVYLSCADYDSGNPLPGLDAITPLTLGTACPAVTLTSVNSYPQGTVAYGRITCVDQFGNLLTKYYPCAKGNNRWKVVTACIV